LPAPKLDRLQDALGRRMGDESLLRLALTHRSTGSLNNERLEFLGDAVLGLVIADSLYARFPQAGEGTLSRLRAAVVCRETLAIVARALGLGEYLLLGEGEMKSGGDRRDSILANGLEALIGAIYLDGGMAPAREAVHRLFDTQLEALRADDDIKDPKSRLQEWVQGRGLALPEYTVANVSGESHRQTFEVECRVAGCEHAFRASGTSRRRAEQAAAELAFEFLTRQ
jgi:ribonuclease-3